MLRTVGRVASHCLRPHVFGSWPPRRSLVQNNGAVCVTTLRMTRRIPARTSSLFVNTSRVSSRGRRSAPCFLFCNRGSRAAVDHAGMASLALRGSHHGGRRHCTVGRPAFAGRDKRAERRAPVRLETGRLIADACRYATRGESLNTSATPSYADSGTKETRARVLMNERGIAWQRS